MAAPRAARSEGLMAVDEVAGARMVVVAEKRDWRFVAMRGVWDVPPERITWERTSVRWIKTRRIEVGY